MFFRLLQKLSGLTKLQLARLSKKLEKEAAQARDLRTAAFKVSNAEPGSILNSILRHSEPDPREFPSVLVSVDFFFFEGGGFYFQVTGPCLDEILSVDLHVLFGGTGKDSSDYLGVRQPGRQRRGDPQAAYRHRPRGGQRGGCTAGDRGRNQDGRHQVSPLTFQVENRF